MGKINDGVMKAWKDGEIVYAADFVQEREMLRTALNDNYGRLIKKYEVLNPDGTVKATQNLDTAINYMKFKETSQIVFTLDSTTSTLTIGIIDGSITTAKLQNLGVTTSKIADLNVTTTKIADLNVTTGKLADKSVNLQKLDLADLDTRYYTKVQLDNGSLDHRYYTESEVNKLLSDTSGGMAISVYRDTTFPTTHNESDVLYRTDTDKFYISNGSTWQEFAKQSNVNNQVSTAETNAINFTKSHGLGASAKDINGTDLNLLRYTGFYRGHRSTGGVTNAPPQNSGDQTWFYVIHIEHDQNWSWQYTIDFNNNSVQTRQSKDNAGVRSWSAWRKVAHSSDVATAEANAKAYSVPVGTVNADISKVKTMLVPTHTRSSALSYNTSGQLAKVEEKDGTTILKTTDLAYTSGKLSTVTETVDGNTITTTLNYDANGNLSSVTRSVT